MYGELAAMLRYPAIVYVNRIVSVELDQHKYSRIGLSRKIAE